MDNELSEEIFKPDKGLGVGRESQHCGEIPMSTFETCQVT